MTFGQLENLAWRRWGPVASESLDERRHLTFERFDTLSKRRFLGHWLGFKPVLEEPRRHTTGASDLFAQLAVGGHLAREESRDGFFRQSAQAPRPSRTRSTSAKPAAARIRAA